MFFVKTDTNSMTNQCYQPGLKKSFTLTTSAKGTVLK
jgi:hypothetical protein